MTPLKINVMVRKDKELKTKLSGGIIIPKGGSEAYHFGQIVSVGPEAKLVKKGDYVIFNSYSGREIVPDKQDFLVIDEADLLAVLEDVENVKEKK